MKKSVKVTICAVIYVLAIAALSALFILLGPSQNTSAAADEFPAYTAAQIENPLYSDLSGWAYEAQNGETRYTAPDGTAYFVVKRAAAYQKDLAEYVRANLRSITAERTEFLSELSVGEIAGRETYVFRYADYGIVPTQYRKVYFFNIDGRTYGAMGAAASPEALEQIDFDAIVANYDF